MGYPDDWVQRMAKQAEHKLIFLCGGAANEPAIRALCSKVIWLKNDEATIRKRVNMPRDHDYGTKPHELADAIAQNNLKEEEYRNYGAIIVDTTQPLEDVIEEILTKL
jgi:shikimate kinase